MRKIIPVYLQIGIAVAGAVFAIFLYFHRSATTPVKAVSAETAVQVKMAVVEEKDVPGYLLLTGELRAEKESLVATDTAGIVVHAAIERGMAVEKGKVLVKLDDRDAILAVREAKANLNSAMSDFEHVKKELERNEKLANVKVVSDSTLQKARADNDIKAAALSVAEIRLDKAEKNLADCVTLAPFDGFVVERKVQIGEYVQAGTVVAQLMKIDILRLVLNVPETAVGSISAGQKVSFTVGAYPDVFFSGRVKYMGPAVRGSSRDLVIEAEVINSDGRLKPGMFASAKQEVDLSKKTVVPKDALRANGNSFHVFAVQNEHVVEKLVEPGISVGTWVEVRGGLNPGEKVVLAPESNLKDGDRVKS